MSPLNEPVGTCLSENSREIDTMRKCKVHTVHFYNPYVRAIHCMAYEGKSKRLAISRSDGCVEVWAMGNAPHIERVFHAGSVEALAWSGERLFSAGLHGNVVEFDMLSLSIQYEVPVVSGPVWCIAVDDANTMLAAGTEGGYVNVLELLDGCAPRPLRLLDKQEGRVLCIAWHPDGLRLATGSTDALRLWDVTTGHATHRMTVGRDARMLETTVWCVAVTRHDLVVAGDSRGVLSFWDMKSGTQSLALVTHAGPVLALTLDENHSTVYCAGVDPVIVCIGRTEQGRWVRGIDRRLHEHDVRALACAGKQLFSAGVDGHLAVSSYPPKMLTKYPPIPQGAVALCAARCLLLRHSHHLELWRLGDSNQSQATELLHIKVRDPMVCAAVSPNADWVLYATPTLTRLAQVTPCEDRVARVKAKSLCAGAGGALAAAFSPHAPWVAVAMRSGEVLVLEYSDSGKPQRLARLRPRVEGHLVDTVGLLSFSACGATLAVADVGGRVAAWDTTTWTLRTALPASRCAAVALAMRPGFLTAIYANQTMVEVSLETSELSDWSRRLDLPRSWTSRTAVVTNASYDTTRDDHLLLADDTALFGLRPRNEPMETSTKRSRVPEGGNDGNDGNDGNELVTLKKYKHLVFAGWLGDDELVVVETTPDALEQDLPDVLHKPHFGTK